ncbi:MAG: AbrB family transcriptional regulator [Methylibium sp. NZG]|nr:MAG: AbrB family transcriptional regulator [Methylibium sp. NZG]
MPSTLSSRGQVTIPKRIREALKLMPGARLEFSMNASGELLLRAQRPMHGTRGSVEDRFDAARGRADIPWRTEELMKLLRTDD